MPLASAPTTPTPAPTATQRAVARALRSGERVSGAELASRSGVSRAAIWKQIRFLEEHGWRIEAVPSRGYRLVQPADRLSELELTGALPDEFLATRRLIHFDALASTNHEAALWAASRAADEVPHGSLFVAERQAAGRGRLDRAWESRAGADFTGSFVLRPALPPERGPLVTLAVAVAVVRAAQRVLTGTPARVGIKWPNDVLIADAAGAERKLAGVLTEMQADPDRIHFVVAGVGVNVNSRARDRAAALRPVAVSLADVLGRAADRIRFAADLWVEVLSAVDRLVAGAAGVLDEWRALSFTPGREVRVTAFDRTIAGRARDIDAAGRLLVETGAGVEAVSSADIEHLR